LTEQIEKGEVSATRAQALGGHINYKKKAGQKPKQEEVENLFSLVKQCKNEKEVIKILFPQGQQTTTHENELDDELKTLVEEAKGLTVRGDKLEGYIQEKTKDKEQALSFETNVKDQEFQAPSVSRYINKRLEAFVWYRDNGKCTECGATGNLEIDHIKPYSHFGAHTPEITHAILYPCTAKSTCTSPCF
jgi:hypothetical protein